MKKCQWFLILIMVALSGCQSETPPVEDTPPHDPDSGLNPISPSLVYSTGWSDVIIRANYAKTTVDSGAHFSTNRNACGKDAYGVLEVEDWNALAKNINLAMAGEDRVEDYCVSPPSDTDKYMDGTVEVKTGDKTKLLFEIRDWQICSRIQDAQISDELLKAINRIIVIADKEECPNGWGN